MTSREKNALKDLYRWKAKAVIESEIELINKQMEFPKFFLSQANTWKSPLHLNPDIIKLIDIMEIVSGFLYLEGVTMSNGQLVSLSQLSNGFERLFNIRFSDIYKKEVNVIERKPNKLVGFLDRLKAVIKKKSKDDGYNI